MMNRKGVELAMSTIVIGIVLIVVMVIVLMIFRGVWSDANLPGFIQCENRIGGNWECKDEKQDGIVCVEGGCPTTAKYCCRMGDD